MSPSYGLDLLYAGPDAQEDGMTVGLERCGYIIVSVDLGWINPAIPDTSIPDARFRPNNHECSASRD